MTTPTAHAEQIENLPNGEWHNHASCLRHRYLQANAWTPNGGGAYRSPEARAAKDVCWYECPVRDYCLAEALENGEQRGIWGGRDPADRAAIAVAHR